MKVLAYYPIHYGSEYLEASILSINDHVDKILILYTETPSYGQNGGLKNPDTREKLKEIANKASNKIEWVEIHPETTQENVHRRMAFHYSHGYDLIMAVDADEIWDNVEEAQKAAYETGALHVNVNGSQWYHFWRSFNECHQDGFAPTRFHVVNGRPDQVAISKGTVYHMGYAQSEAITRYKISCHGHKSILHSWIESKWINYVKGETTLLHPDSQTVWVETNDFDKTTLPKVLKDHVNYNLDRIL